MNATSRRQHGGTGKDKGTAATKPRHRSAIDSSALLDMEEVARWLATSPRHVQRLVTERRIPFVKVGHFVRFDPEDVAGWIEGQKVVAVGASLGTKPGPAHPAGNVGRQSLAPRTTGRQAPSSDNQSPAWMRHRAR